MFLFSKPLPDRGSTSSFNLKEGYLTDWSKLSGDLSTTAKT